MNSYVLFSDSTSDLPVEILEKLDIHIIPMLFEMDGKEYKHFPDAREFPIKDFYDKLRIGEKSITTQINYTEYINYFSPFLEKGLDVIYLAFSSGLSGTYNASLIAIEELKETYPMRKIISIDTKAASVGEGMLCYNAALQMQKGATIDELAQWVKEQKDHLCHWFTVDDLNHLKRGGRISTVAAVMGTALGIKPVMHVDDEGHLMPVEKVRGRKNSLDSLVVHMKKTAINPSEQTVFIGHGDSLEDAKYVKQRVMEEFGTKEVIITTIGPIIGTHSGPGTMALFFFGTNKN